MGLELFRAAAAVAPAGDVGTDGRLVPGILRFSLLYRQQPDPAVQRRRLKQLFGASGFELFPLPSGDDPNILILQFPLVPRQQSAEYLFASADALVDELDLAACTPDADPGWVAEGVLTPTPPESVLGGIVWALCTSHGGAPQDKRWSVKSVRADTAWAFFGTTGEGIRIAQPDTGVAEHREIEEGIALDLGTDILAGGGKPIDPLSAEMKSPGHGTATSSVVVSRGSGAITGVAPGATLVPIRCVNHVLLSSGAALAAAIDHARGQSCDVVTMSLGGPIAFQDLKRSIARAVEAGMIVLAAAGNCVKVLVYPAWDPNVIAVAATSSRDTAWKGTSVDHRITIAAPGEDVYVARRKSPADPVFDHVEPGQGTSFAVSTVAGCAALWLGHHGRAAVRAEAAARGTTVQALFRAALGQSARRPAGWPAHGMGAGIADAVDLLALPLRDIVLAPPPDEATPTWAGIGPEFNWTRFGAEAGYIWVDRAQRANPDRAVALENAIAPRPSAGLSAALARHNALPRTRLAAPRLVAPPLPDIKPAAALRVIAKLPGGQAETGGTITEASARDYLKGSGRQAVLDAFDRIDQALTAARPATAASPQARAEAAAAAELRAKVRTLAPEVLEAFIDNRARSAVDFTGEQRFAAEALIRLTGRPALRLVDGAVDINDPQLGDWRSDLSISRPALEPLVAAVGRIDVEHEGRWSHAGTGTHVAPGVIMTNRHVLEAFAEQLPAAEGRRFEILARASIIFDEGARRPSQRFAITGIIAAGPDRIGRFADPAKLDIAFLGAESSNAAGGVLPPPVAPGEMPDPASGTPRIAVVGYPAAPDGSASIDPRTGLVSASIEDALWRVYRGEYGVKYISPGEVMPDPLPGDARRWAFAHDATTLGGNSGSALLSLGARHRVCGLHFAGAPLTYNMAHALAGVQAAVAAEQALLAAAWPIGPGV